MYRTQSFIAVCVRCGRARYSTGHKFEATQVSSEARDDGEAAKLWRYSEKLVGLSTV
jgi:hypothetical protein